MNKPSPMQPAEAKSKKSGLVAYLIDNNLADAARVAVAASHEF